MKVLMVCLGNICRSPIAHGILENKVKLQGLDWEVDSAGTGGYHVGNHPDPRSIDEANRRGIDISNQVCRQLTKQDLQYFDHVLVMDAMNYQNTKALAQKPAEAMKIELIRNFDTPGRNQQVPDPYWDDDGFAGVYDMLEKAIDGFIQTHLNS